VAPSKAKVFISSSMRELPEERKVIHDLITGLEFFEPFAYEFDAVASSGSPKELWERDLDTSQVCLAILWKKLGEWTVAEIERAEELGIETLVFVKVEDTNDDGLTEPATTEVLDYLNSKTHPDDGVFSEARFTEAEQLNKKVRDALQSSLTKQFLENQETTRRERLNEGGPIPSVSRTASEVSPEIGDGVVETRPDKSLAIPLDKRPVVPIFPRQFLGRSFDRERLAGLVDRGEHFIAVTGLDEMGRKSLVQVMAHEEFAEQFPDGAGLVPELRTAAAATPEGASPLPDDGAGPGHDDAVRDVLQAIWASAFKRDAGMDLKDLKNLKALIALFDVDLDEEKIDQLVQAVPKSVIVATMADGALVESAYRPIALPPMAGDELVDAFSEQAMVTVPDDLKPALEAAFASTGGAPAQVVELANDAYNARVSADTLGDWLSSLGSA